MRHRRKSILSFFFPALLFLAYAGIWICRINQWDSLTHITLIPFWVWAIPGLTLALASVITLRTPFSIAVLSLWLVSTILSTGELRSLSRQLRASISGNPGTGESPGFRILSLNCRNGPAPFAELAGLHPDIVLLQNLPAEMDLESEVRVLFEENGSFANGESCAILGRGRFLTFAEDESTPAIHSRFKSDGGMLFDLTNVALERSIPAWDFWSGEHRERLLRLRKQNRKSVRRFIDSYRKNSDQPARIVAGDFGTPPGDDIFRPLRRAGLRDVFAVSGHGLGNTHPPRFPLFRLDQIWVSSELRPRRTFVRELGDSTLRVTVCDFVVGSGEG